MDVARALLIWREVHNAALAIAENAEELSVTVDPTSGLVTSELTYDQMQQAMSTVFAEIPGLNQGNGTGEFTGSLAVTLSSVWFYPLCQSANLSGCEAADTLFALERLLGPHLCRGWRAADWGGCAAVHGRPADPGGGVSGQRNAILRHGGTPRWCWAARLC